MIPFISPENFTSYELIDSGHGQKLEQYGARLLVRPEPQAIWSPRLSKDDWASKADAEFIQEGSHKGNWITRNSPRKAWEIDYESNSFKLRFKLNFTAFKHIGIFPEQASNWDYIYKECEVRKSPKVLNLFAYTGGASLAAKAAGADVIHLDSVKQVINWASENQQLSGLKDIRWVVEDALKFVQREVKRGHKYDGIMLDPPAYGIGASGERWKLEEKLGEMLHNVALLLQPEGFLVLNVYSLGISPYSIQNLMADHLGFRSFTISELGLHSQTGQKLSLGIVARI